jgi:hypothetical protein
MKITISFTPTEVPALLPLVRCALSVGASESVLLTLQRTSSTDSGEGSPCDNVRPSVDTGFPTHA